MTKFLVLYDEISTGPIEIMQGLDQLGDVMFAISQSASNERMAHFIKAFAPTITLPPGDQDAVRKVRTLRPDAVLTFSERQVRRTAFLVERLDLPGNVPATAALLTDKSRQRERLRVAGVDWVRSVRLDDSHDWPDCMAEIGLPAVVKPLMGEASRDAYRVDDPAMGARLAAELPLPLVVEEYLQGRPCGPYGDYVSVESVVVDGRVFNVAVTGTFPLLDPFRETGKFWPAVLSSGDAALACALAGSALEALGFSTGVAHTEIKLTATGPRIIEVNGRLGGFVAELYLRALGINLVELAGLVALGRKVAPECAQPSKDGLARVFYQYSNPAPRRNAELMAVHGTAEVRKLAGISGYWRFISPGKMVRDTVMTQRLDIITGSAPTHLDMLATLHLALRRLTFKFRFDSKLLCLRGDELPGFQ